jgi:hypothetical protein
VAIPWIALVLSAALCVKKDFIYGMSSMVVNGRRKSSRPAYTRIRKADCFCGAITNATRFCRGGWLIVRLSPLTTTCWLQLSPRFKELVVLLLVSIWISFVPSRTTDYLLYACTTVQIWRPNFGWCSGGCILLACIMQDSAPPFPKFGVRRPTNCNGIVRRSISTTVLCTTNLFR